MSVYEQSSFSSHEGPVTQELGDCDSPCDYFLAFFDDEIRNNVLFQSNLYVNQKQKGRSVLPITERELFGYLGINLLIGYHRLPSWLDYWKNESKVIYQSLTTRKHISPMKY